MIIMTIIIMITKVKIIQQVITVILPMVIANNKSFSNKNSDKSINWNHALLTQALQNLVFIILSKWSGSV